ncbi:uncharacterized protein LOC135837306 [Planococcus citri]|uniref:uncharacterized protein LOC135837306 n=1 Tax=Planococcus citri TaxID=170843 RepID=UPI0031F8F6B0
MSLYSITKIIIFILIQLKDFSSTQEIHLENDLTKHIDEWVTSIFSISGNDGVHIITQMIGCTPKEFEYNITNHVNHSQTEFLFQRIHLTLKGESEQIEFDRPQIHWNFAENKINFVFLEIRIKIQAGIAIAKAQPRGKRCSSMNDYICWCSFENFTISAVGTRVKDDQLKVSYNTTYSSFGITDLRTFNQISMNENKNLVQEITPAMQMILEQNFHNNVKFIHELDKIFQVQEEPRKKIISAHPHFSTNPQQCNYLIQEIPFLGFILKRIVISGMSNFESYNVDHSSNETYTRTLLIRNVQGNMTLDY